MPPLIKLTVFLCIALTVFPSGSPGSHRYEKLSRQSLRITSGEGFRLVLEAESFLPQRLTVELVPSWATSFSAKPELSLHLSVAPSAAVARRPQQPHKPASFTFLWSSRSKNA